MENELKEYIVSLGSYDDLDSFYKDMETSGSNGFVPEREVKIISRRPTSRNTHYLMSRSEAEVLINDPRVIAVSPTIYDIGLEVKPCARFSKSAQATQGELNWGLLRSYSGQHTPTWGEDVIPQGFSVDYGYTAGPVREVPDDFLKIFPQGEDVDVVISDGIINPDHPEMKLNPDGTGPSRVIQYNWYQHNPQVNNTPASQYQYDFNNPSFTIENNHGAHVAGIACGNTQGWARKANIYNISPYRDDLYTHIDYIRAFHNSKPVNPKTGRKNPTIVNLSWRLAGTFFGKMSSINYRNQTYNNVSTFTVNYLRDTFHLNCFKPSSVVEVINGVTVSRPPTSDEMSVYYNGQDITIEYDIMDAIKDGIIFVGAAGNEIIYMSLVGDQDYNNRICFTPSGSPVPTCIYFSRPASPSGAVDWSRNGIPNVICVGASDSLSQDCKAYYSNIGPRIDVFAPGTWIISSINSTTTPNNISTTRDARNTNFFLQKYNGTSMASPQVCGILACMLQKYPNMNQWTARDFLEKQMVKKNQLNPLFPPYYQQFFTKLTNTKNNYLFFPKEAVEVGQKFPNSTFFVRAESGKLFPRTKNKFFK